MNNKKFKNLMIFIFFAISIFVFSNMIKAQPINPLPPPTAGGCYDLINLGCDGGWVGVPWQYIRLSGLFPPPNNQCEWWCDLNFRYCPTNPNIVEVAIGYFGYFPLLPYGDCSGIEAKYPYPNTTAANQEVEDILSYALAVYTSTPSNTSDPAWKAAHSCNGGTPIQYTRWLPGNCAAFCYYRDYSNGGTITTVNVVCTNAYCCGYMFNVCWDNNLQQVVVSPPIPIDQNPDGICSDPGGNDWYPQCPSPPLGKNGQPMTQLQSSGCILSCPGAP